MYKAVFSRYRIVAVVTIFMILGVFLTRLPQAQAHFVIADWDYDDGYGQGIEILWIQENSTGAWVTYPDTGRGHLWFESGDETTISLNYTPNTALRVEADVNINHTLFDFGPDKSENASARAIMRVSLTVSSPYGILFSLENMTWFGNVYDDTATTWAFDYVDVIEMIIQAGTIYVVRFVYEILW